MGRTDDPPERNDDQDDDLKARRGGQKGVLTKIHNIDSLRTK
jgi:hypothetical protein